MNVVRLACQAMATRFELALYGDDVVRMRAAGEEAIDEINRLNDQLSAFRPQSQISRVNAGASTGPVHIDSELFSLLSHIQSLSQITNGAFDVTVGPLLEVWGFRTGSDSVPDDREVSEALRQVGMSYLALDTQNRTVSFDRIGMQLDLGGIGKGYALDVATEVLQTAGVFCALLHGGTSTVRAIGLDPNGDRWKVAVRPPFSDVDAAHLGVVTLEDEAMSVSAVSGRCFEADGRVYGHVIDPRSGYPVRVADLAVAVLPNATDADALSTGLLVLGAEGISVLNRRVAGFRGSVNPGRPDRLGQLNHPKHLKLGTESPLIDLITS